MSHEPRLSGYRARRGGGSARTVGSHSCLWTAIQSPNSGPSRSRSRRFTECSAMPGTPAISHGCERPTRALPVSSGPSPLRRFNDDRGPGTRGDSDQRGGGAAFGVEARRRRHPGGTSELGRAMMPPGRRGGTGRGTPRRRIPGLDLMPGAKVGAGPLLVCLERMGASEASRRFYD